MPKKDKFFDFLSRLEVVAAVVLFFVMLTCCGLYINIKMNGNSSSLPSLPEKEKAMLMKSDYSDSVVYTDDLLEPCFMGIKIDDDMKAASFNSSSRKILEETVYDTAFSLFSGKIESVEFESLRQRSEFIDSLKQSPKFMLISFFKDIPSSVFMPCFSKNYVIESQKNQFYVKHMFVLADDSDNVYAICLSSDNNVTKLVPDENILFGKIFSHSYDVNSGFCYFDFLDINGIYPVLTSTVDVNNYSIASLSVNDGKEFESEWVRSLLEYFGFNMSLVKSFTSGDKKEINYVDEMSELLIKDNGEVCFTASNEAGINLSEYLEYYPEDGVYSFNDKIFAVKNIVNELNFGDDGISFCIVDVEYNDNSDILTVSLKSMIDGIFISEKKADSVFEIHGNNIIGVQFDALEVTKADTTSKLMPQLYAVYLFDSSNECYAVMKKINENDLHYSPLWLGYDNIGAEVSN